MTDKKVCIRFKRTAAGRRCASYDYVGVKRNRRTSKVYRRQRCTKSKG